MEGNRVCEGAVDQKTDEIEISWWFRSQERAILLGVIGGIMVALVQIYLIFPLGVWLFANEPAFVQEVYLEPGEPVAGENFSVVIRLTHYTDFSDWDGRYLV